MADEKNITSCVLAHQRVQALHDEAVGVDGVAHLRFGKRQFTIEQIGGLTFRIGDRLFPGRHI